MAGGQMYGSAPLVFGDNHSELPDIAAEPGSDNGGPPGAHKGMVGKTKGHFPLYISQLVVDEASAGDTVAAREWLKAPKIFPCWTSRLEVTELASGILASGKIARLLPTLRISPSQPCTEWIS